MNNICNFNFLVPIYVSNKLLSFTYNLSEYLQTKDIDLVNAIESVSEVSKKLQDMRENSNVKFHEIYEGVKSISVLLNVNETMPRICVRQKIRNNMPFKDIEEFYRRTLFIPYLDVLLCSLKQRFISHKETIKSLQYVLPSLAVDNPFSYLKPAVL